VTDTYSDGRIAGDEGSAVFRMSRPELLAAAESGDQAAQAELDRRAANKTHKREASAADGGGSE
jgi:hypothetical protein